VWLVVLHYTLGRLVDELREQPKAAPAEDVQRLQGELEALRQVVSRVEDQLGQARGSEPRQGRVTAPLRPVEKGAAVDEDDDDDGGTGDESGTDGGTEDGPGEDPPDEDEGEDDDAKGHKAKAFGAAGDEPKGPPEKVVPPSRQIRVPEGKQP
jgi:hypothetical protein